MDIIRLFFSSLIALFLGYEIYIKFNQDSKDDYLPIVSGDILPGVLFALIIISIIVLGINKTILNIIPLIIQIGINIGLYYLFLILILPLFKDKISHRTRAMLWILPNMLYLASHSIFKLNYPSIIIKIPNGIYKIIMIVWLIGFISIFTYKLLEHILFKRKLIKSSRPIQDTNILTIYQNIIQEMNIKKANFKLIQSSLIQVPLSIGLFRFSTYIVLPNKQYTNEELELIFKHELVHIQRNDASSKFFSIFMCSLFFFNPLMWIAMKEVNKDLELSCDETVLLNKKQDIRKKYASLLLSEIGEAKGYTTSLSANYKTMKQRIEEALYNKPKTSGAMISSLIFFIMLISMNHITFAYNTTSLNDKIDPTYLENLTINTVFKDKGTNIEYEKVNEQALIDYIFNLKCHELTGNYDYESDNEYTYICNNVIITLNDYRIKITDIEHIDDGTTYYLSEKVDFDLIETYIHPFPTLKVELSNSNDHTDSNAKLMQVNKQNEMIYNYELIDESETFGVVTSDKYDNMKLCFEKLPNSSIKITALSMNKKDTKTYEFKANKEINFKLPYDYGYYTIQTSFINEDKSIYEITYRYDITMMDEN